MHNKFLRVSHLLGCAGVAAHETSTARKMAVILEVPMIMAAVWILINWWSTDNQIKAGADIYDLLLWVLFVVETGLLSIMVHHKAYYLRSNWLNLVVIVMGLPMLLGYDIYFGALRLLRLIVLLSLLLHVGSRLRTLLSRNQLGTTLLACVIVIFMAGTMMAAIDPAIETAGDGIWWAWVTVTTVGYGDLVPSSMAGKIFASLVILLGLALFSLLTGAFAALFIEKQEEELLAAEQQAIITKLDELAERLDRMEEAIHNSVTTGQCEKTSLTVDD